MISEFKTSSKGQLSLLLSFNGLSTQAYIVLKSFSLHLAYAKRFVVLY